MVRVNRVRVRVRVKTLAIADRNPLAGSCHSADCRGISMLFTALHLNLFQTHFI